MILLISVACHVAVSVTLPPALLEGPEGVNYWELGLAGFTLGKWVQATGNGKKMLKIKNGNGI